MQYMKYQKYIMSGIERYISIINNSHVDNGTNRQKEYINCTNDDTGLDRLDSLRNCSIPIDAQIIYVNARATEIDGVEQAPPIYPIDATMSNANPSGYKFDLIATTSNGQPLTNDVVVSVGVSPFGMDLLTLGVDYNFISTGSTAFETSSSPVSLGFGIEILGNGMNGILIVSFTMVSGGILLDENEAPINSDNFTISLITPPA